MNDYRVVESALNKSYCEDFQTTQRIVEVERKMSVYEMLNQETEMIAECLEMTSKLSMALFNDVRPPQDEPTPDCIMTHIAVNRQGVEILKDEIRRLLSGLHGDGNDKDCAIGGMAK